MQVILPVFKILFRVLLYPPRCTFLAVFFFFFLPFWLSIHSLASPLIAWGLPHTRTSRLVAYSWSFSFLFLEYIHHTLILHLAHDIHGIYAYP